MSVRTAPLGNVCRFVGGGTPSRKRPEFFLGDIPWATVKDFKTFRLADTEEHISEEGVRASATNIVEQGTVLLVTRVGLGKVATAGCRMAINQDIKGLVPREDILPEYLFWFLLSQAPIIERMGTGATVKGVTLQDIRTIEIPLLPYEEQRRLVDLLSRAEGIVRLRREAQKKAAEIIPALFLDMFGDPATNPKGWPRQRVGEVADVQSGLQVTAARATLPLERPYLRVANVYRSYLNLHEVKNIRLTENELARTRLQSGDLLIVEGHGNPLEVGRVAMWFDEIADCVHQNHLIRARPHRDVVSPRYACAFLNSEAGRTALLQSGKTTSGLSTISTSNVKDAPILIPPLERQAHFESLCYGFLGLEKQQTDALAKAEATFASLLAKVFQNKKS